MQSRLRFDDLSHRTLKIRFLGNHLDLVFDVLEREVLRLARLALPISSVSVRIVGEIGRDNQFSLH